MSPIVYTLNRSPAGPTETASAGRGIQEFAAKIAAAASIRISLRIFTRLPESKLYDDVSERDTVHATVKSRLAAKHPRYVIAGDRSARHFRRRSGREPRG